MSLLDFSVFAAYFLSMGLLAVYGFHRLVLVYLATRHRAEPPPPPPGPDPLPMLTVQIPLYNEACVAERIIDAACALDYPKERLEIQILDDSTDETSERCRLRVEAYRARRFRIVHRRRESRDGYKAGALEAGLREAAGEFVAIFDADFVPPPDFARRVLPHFADPRVGMVQARWGHLNRDYSGLTRAQAIFLDGHFLVEQLARNRSGRFFNFNGTAGIWRRSCIESAGGWQHDTLTEDLDLSYRAQLAGWRFRFLPGVVAPAELPIEMNAFKSQQHRWAKGSIQTGLKLLPRILRSPLPPSVKSEAFFHLTSNVAYVLMGVVSLLFPLVLRIRERLPWRDLLALDLPILFLATGSVLAFYLTSQRLSRAGWLESMRALPSLMAVGVGLCLNNSRAVLEALLGRRTEFVRTPKLAVGDSGALPGPARYRGRLSPLTFLELAAGIYFSVAVVYALRHHLYTGLPFLVLFLAGYLTTAVRSIRPSLRPSAPG